MATVTGFDAGTASGTVSSCRHVGQEICVPALRLLIDKRLWHCTQRKRIDMRGHLQGRDLPVQPAPVPDRLGLTMVVASCRRNESHRTACAEFSRDSAVVSLPTRGTGAPDSLRVEPNGRR